MQTYNKAVLVKELLTYFDSPDLHTQHLAGAGPVYALEQKLAEHWNMKHAIAFSSASQAMLALALCLGVKNGEVITSPFSWGGAVYPWVLAGSKIRFSGFDPDTYGLSPECFLHNFYPKTKVVLATDFAGNPSDVKALKEVTDAHDLLLVCDASQSFGALQTDGTPAGYYADVIVTSFGPTKTIFGGEGGALVTNNTDLFEKLIQISQHPERQKKHFPRNEVSGWGINGRMNPVSAFIILNTWTTGIELLHERQECFFSLYDSYSAAGIIKRKNFLTHPHASTFWLPVFEVESGICVSDTDCLRGHDLLRHSLPQLLSRRILRRHCLNGCGIPLAKESNYVILTVSGCNSAVSSVPKSKYT